MVTAARRANAAKAKRADLSVKSPKVSVASALPSRPVDLSATVKNGGTATAKAATLRGYLTKSGKRGKGEIQLLGKVATKSLDNDKDLREGLGRAGPRADRLARASAGV